MLEITNLDSATRNCVGKLLIYTFSTQSWYLPPHAFQPSALVLPFTLPLSPLGRPFQPHGQTAGGQSRRDGAGQVGVHFEEACVRLGYLPSTVRW